MSSPPSLADVTLRDPEGAALRLGDLVDRPTVLALPRYYG